MLDLLCFRWQQLESRGAWENETLHIVSQLPPLYVCQISSESNNFQRKKAGEEKSGQSKKHILHEMLDQPCFYSKKTWVKGNVGSWDSACSLVDYLHYVSAEFQTNPTTFRVKGLATKEAANEKIQYSRDARPTLLPMTTTRGKGSLGKLYFAYC